MKRLSFMTVALFLDYIFKEASGKDIERLSDLYERIFEDVRNAGYEWVDLSSWETEALHKKVVLSLLSKYGLKVSSYIHFESFAELEKNAPECLELAYEGVDTAAALGSDFLMIGIQDRGDIAGKDPQKIREQLIAYFRGICDYAKEKGVTPVIENIPDAGLSLCRWEDVRAMMDEVPGLGYIYDSGTLLVAEEDSADYISALRDRLVYVHLKDMTETKAPEGPYFASASGRLLVNAPTGKGLVDMKTVLDQLAKAGYQGRMSVEFCPDEGMELFDSIVRSKEYVENLLF